ncbi:hypothetical protein [Actinomadura formosensis]|uniref:hypothetical protein n=1 Tax=Actinomadura formosensis TaxID=60706 RepID=UPI003D8C4F34
MLIESEWTGVTLCAPSLDGAMIKHVREVTARLRSSRLSTASTAHVRDHRYAAAVQRVMELDLSF